MTAVPDLDELVAGMIPPRIRSGGTVYTGRLLSFVQAEELRAEFLTTTTAADQAAFVTKACEAVNLPVEPILALPPAAMWRVVGGFFDALFAAPGAAPADSPSNPSGSGNS